MSCRAAPALDQLRTEINALCPGRSTTSDGACASQKHSQQNPNSDHEPDQDGLACARDFTKDVAAGCDGRMVDRIIATRDKRLKYVIFNYAIGKSYPWTEKKTGIHYQAWEWGPYRGPNPHDHHFHVSIHQDGKRDTRRWFGAAPSTATGRLTMLLKYGQDWWLVAAGDDVMLRRRYIGSGVLLAMLQSAAPPLPVIVATTSDQLDKFPLAA